MASERNPSTGKTGITDRIKQDGKQKIETTKRSAADQIDQVAQALTRAGEELGQSQPTLANYASQISSSVSTFAARLRDGNMDELVTDARELARRNPGLFLIGGVALGFAVSRFLKASGDQMANQYSGDYSGSSSDDYVSGDYGQESYTQGSSQGSSYSGQGSTYAGSQDTTVDVESTTYGSGSRSASDYTSRSNGG
jgi:hypothetical protein